MWALSAQTHVEFISLNRLQIQGNRVLPGRLLINVADAVRRQINLAILLLGEFELPGAQIISVCGDIPASSRKTYPSYKPTLSCTNKRTSSGRYDGRSAVVRSMLFRNIRHVTDGIREGRITGGLGMRKLAAG